MAAAVLAGALGPAAPAGAIGGGAPVADGAYRYLATLDIGTGEARRSCSGALVDRLWVITARSCFATGQGPAGLGEPAEATTATVGRADLAGSTGQVVPVVHLVPHTTRDVLLAKLATPVTDIAPVQIGTAAPAVGDTLRLAGHGRTASEWVPARAHTSTARVTAVGGASLDVSGTDAAQSDPCKGDAGGPALRENGGTATLVALHHTSWQHGCLGETTTRQGAVETRVDDLAGWVRQTTADVGVYGVRADGRLTYTAIDSASGDRVGTVASAQSLGFPAKALAALNATTLLVTSTAGQLYRVDIVATDPLAFAVPVQIGTGYTHDHLAYDGDGSLFGIAGGVLRRYKVTSAKPTYLIGNTVIDSGFGLRTLTATGPDWILGTVADGRLRSYRIAGAGAWTGGNLATSGWGGYTHLLSPGDGLYYARTPAGGMQRFRDPAPFDGTGADLQSFPDDPVDTAGWDQVLLSAVPLRSLPRSRADVSVYGVRTDGRLTYSEIDSASGDRLRTVVSERALGFSAKALAALNHDTLLVTSTDGRLHRVDIVATNPLVFRPPVFIATGYSHDRLAYDGDGSLFGIAGGVLRRYTVTDRKPAQVSGNTVIDSGFSLRTLTATGPDWILGTLANGRLVSYRITGAGAWTRADLATTGWADYTHLLSPGDGHYYARTATGALLRFRDPAPFDGSGADLRSFPNDPVDAAGWDQTLLSAVPFIA